MKVTKEELEAMYYSKSNLEMSKILNVSVGYIPMLMDKYGIKKKGKSFKSNNKLNVID